MAKPLHVPLLLNAGNGSSLACEPTQLVAWSLPAVVKAAPADSHRHVSDRHDLLDQLREQKGDEDGQRHGLGLGITALGRRSLQVHGKDELEPPSSPRSTQSGESARTVSARTPRVQSAQDIKEQLDEVAVEREMNREARGAVKEAEEMELVDRVRHSPIVEEKGGGREVPALVRIVSNQRAAIVQLRVFEEIGSFAILREDGILELVSLQSLEVEHTIDLEASKSKLPGFWQWHSVHLASKDDIALLIAVGRPWPSQISADATRIVMVTFPDVAVAARLEIPGLGDAGVVSDSQESHLLHVTATSLRSYPIIFPGTTASPTRTPSPRVVSAVSSPLLGRPEIRRTGSLASIRPKERDKGLAKFLGVGGRREKGKEADEVPTGLGDGQEVERDGGGAWTRIEMKDDGEGVGLAEDAVHAFRFDGKRLRIEGRLDVRASQVHYSRGWKDLIIVADGQAKLYGRDRDKGFIERATFPAASVCLLDNDVCLASDKLLTVDTRTMATRSHTCIAPGQPRDVLCPLSPRDLFVANAFGTVRKQSSLDHHIIVASVDGTVSIFSLDTMDPVFLIPAARAPLRNVFISHPDILLAYANGKARVWNVETQEFRRSTGLDAAEDMLQSANWSPIDLDKADDGVLSGTDLLRLDMTQLSQWIQTVPPLPTLRGLLSIFLTFGVNPAIDDLCLSLGIHPPVRPAAIGPTLVHVADTAAWRVTSEYTGLRQLVVVALTLPFLDAPDAEKAAADIIAWYSSGLPDPVEADLAYFAEYYMDPAVHQAARMLFRTRLARMSNEEVDEVISAHQSALPSNSGAPYADAAVRALTIIGGMAVHRYQSVNPAALKTAADSLLLYLASSCAHLPLAIELTSRGFATWQSYVDPSSLLRRLFHLSTHKDAFGAPVSAAARLAVLHVAATNPALFMSTLSMDILDAKSVEGRTSIMKLCVFMARKRPEVLEHGLPRIAEAVVKSLDPNVGKMRDEVWQAATVILNELVLAYSTIDFHKGTQRLAVGTSEGAVITYDLKTASRLYVLEPHRGRPCAAVGFSPDGRRLVTISLGGLRAPSAAALASPNAERASLAIAREQAAAASASPGAATDDAEGEVTVWKVGQSIGGLFSIGGPPSQGMGRRGEPFKRIAFRRADDKPLDASPALSEVRIEWAGQRHAKVSIRETALSFET
ncbi:hypothetical protein Q5752_001479 [Cryptotrichosporon argae]